GDRDVYVVFQDEKVDRRRYLQSSVYVAEAAKEIVREQLIERRPPRIKRTLARVRAKQCTEIKGRNRIMISERLDRTRRRAAAAAAALEAAEAAEAAEAEQDDTPKENQTQAELPSPEDQAQE